MTTQEFIIENLKCHGCANTIRKGLKSLKGVSEAVINHDNASVTVTFDEAVQTKENIVKKLARMGYPEQGSNSLKAEVVSYVSCAIGRVSG